MSVKKTKSEKRTDRKKKKKRPSDKEETNGGIGKLVHFL